MLRDILLFDDTASAQQANDMKWSQSPADLRSRLYTDPSNTSERALAHLLTGRVSG